LPRQHVAAELVGAERESHRHVVKNAAPTALAVMGLQLGYMLGSILIETVFS
jgi:ABC-type dipeptide/oligopeptide/nickel transport system permease component